MKHFVGVISLFFLTSFAYLKYVKQGTASYYSSKFDGRRTASGEIFRQDSLTAAHNSLPFGTRVKVTNLKNDSVVIVRINDRMGSKSRIIDLSLTAAKKLNFVRQGLTQVRVETIE